MKRKNERNCWKLARRNKCWGPSDIVEKIFLSIALDGAAVSDQTPIQRNSRSGIGKETNFVRPRGEVCHGSCPNPHPRRSEVVWSCKLQNDDDNEPY